MPLYPSNKAELAILAGNGLLPVLLASYLSNKKQKFSLFVFDTFNDSLKNYSPIFSDIEKPLDLIVKLKNLNVEQLIFVGSFSRLSLQNEPIIFGDKGFRELISENYQEGDDKLLREVAKFFEGHGFKILGVHEVLNDIMEYKDIVLSKNQPSKMNIDDTVLAEKIFNQISKFDLGQSVITRNGLCMGIETSTGTDHMIESFGHFMKKNITDLEKSGGILFKACKQGQDRRFDLPTIGTETIRLIHKVGLNGLVVEKGSVIFLDKKEVIKLANKFRIFIWSRSLSA